MQRSKRERQELEANKFWDQPGRFLKSVRLEPKLSATTPLRFCRADYAELPVTMATVVRSNLCYGAPLEREVERDRYEERERGVLTFHVK